MKELFEGRRFGFALRPAVGHIAIGLGLAVTLLDLMAWFGWGVRDTNGFVVAAFWVAVLTAVIAAVAAVMGFIESTDAPEEDRQLARLDVIAALVAVLLYVASAAFRAGDQSAAAANPAALVSALAGLIVLLADGPIGANLYASREWEVLDEDEYEPRRHQKRRHAS